jgi:hypothetical protein
MAPSLRSERTPSARAAAAAAAVTASQPKADTAGTASKRASSQPKSVVFRSDSARRSKCKLPIAREGLSSPQRGDEDSPSQGYNSQIQLPPSAQTQLEEDRGESIEEENDPANFDYDKVRFEIKHDMFVGSKYQFSRVQPWQDYSERTAKFFKKKLNESLSTAMKATITWPTFGPTCIINVGKTNKKQRYKGTVPSVDEYRDVTGGVNWIARKYYEIVTREKLKAGEIEVIWRWEFTSIPLSESSSSDLSTADDENEDSTQSRRRRSSSKKRRKLMKPAGSQSASQRQRRETASDRQIEAIVGDYLIAINDTHACKVASCRNYPKPCVAVPGVGHLPLNTNTLKKWNQLIRDGDATTRECPASVIGELLQERQRNDIRKAGGKPIFDSSTIGPHINFNFGPSGGGFPGFGSELSRPQNMPQSSPPIREGDDDDNMKRYMEWLGDKYPTHFLEWEAFKVTLGDQGWGFSDLRGITDIEWKEMKVGGGFVKKIKRHLKEFAREANVGVDRGVDDS